MSITDRRGARQAARKDAGERARCAARYRADLSAHTGRLIAGGNFERADEHAHGAPARLSWSRLRRRVFDLDVERCVCGGKLKIIAAIEAPTVIVKILTHLGLPARAPPRSPARPLDIFQAA